MTSKPIAIIPARGGSKRILRKNIRLFCGKPIIAYSIEVALESKLFERVIVSTDDEEIAAISKTYGAEVPFMRPSALADDHVTTAEVLVSVLKGLGGGQYPEYCCCIYATAPFLSVVDLRYGLEKLKKNPTPVVLSVARVQFPVQRALLLNESNQLEMFFPDHMTTRSQDLPQAFHDAGQFYWIDVKQFLLDPKLYTKGAIPLMLPSFRVLDIDTEEDWQHAELMYQALNRE